jgi:hypothetical protein
VSVWMGSSPANVIAKDEEKGRRCVFACDRKSQHSCENHHGGVATDSSA